MPKTPKNKVYQRKNYSKDSADMRAALLKAQSSPNINVTEIANTFGVGVDALRRRIKGLVSVDAVVGRKPHLTSNEDRILVEYIKLIAKGGFGFCPKTLREFVELFMTRNGFDTGPSKAWVSRFLIKHEDLSKRFAKNISIQRLESMNRENLNDFYGLLTPLLTDNVPEEVVFNCDEAGFCLTPKEGCLIAPRGIKTIFKAIAAEHHKYITVHVCGNASGRLISPFIIFKGLKRNNKLETWEGAEYYHSDNGWMKKDVFVYWLEHVFFKEATLLRPEGYMGPLFLVFDGHSTHTNLDVIEVASRLNIVLIKLPSHSTHLLQPLDVSFFGPLKTSWFSILDEWNREHNQTLPNQHFPTLLKQTFAKVSTNWLRNGFRATGIFPVNPNAIPDSKIIAAKPWNNNGWRWFDESDTIVQRLKQIEPPQNSNTMESVCLEHIINVLEPKPLPEIQRTTTLTRVPTQEERLKRGNRHAAVLTQPSTAPQPSTSTQTSTDNYLSNTLNLESLNIQSQPSTSDFKELCKQHCLVCFNYIEGARWVCCSLPSCQQWLHVRCVPEVMNKTDDQLSTYEWFCAICKLYRQSDMEEFFRAKIRSKY